MISGQSTICITGLTSVRYNQCCGSESVWIRFILVSRIRIRFVETDPHPGSIKSAKIMENFHINQLKSLEYHTFFFKTIKLMITDINIYPINNKTDHISEEYNFHIKKVKQKLVFSRSRIRIRIRYFTKGLSGRATKKITFCGFPKGLYYLYSFQNYYYI